MTAVELVHELKSLGARLKLADGKLVVDAPKGALTPEIRAAVTEHREKLISLVGISIGACWMHGAGSMRQRQDGGWVCGVCHPNSEEGL